MSRAATDGPILILEPDWEGHRFTYVRYVLDTLNRPVVLATVKGARELPQFVDQLQGRDIDVVECFDEQFPPAAVMASEAARICAERPIAQVGILDADRPLKVWWRAARPLRRLRDRPEVVFLLTRYPLHVFGGAERSVAMMAARRVAMVACILASRLTGVLSQVVVLDQRGRPPQPGFVTRVGDPASNSAHSRDRAELRARHGLDPDATMVGVFGVITMDKNPHLLLDALGPDERLLLGGKQHEPVVDWLAGLAPADRDRVVTVEGYLSEQDLDELMAAVDVVSVVMNYDRPSAIMGKALAAGVPVLNGGSKVRALELAATGAGVDVPITVDGIRDGLRELATRPAGSFDDAAATASPRVLVESIFGADG